MRGRQGKITVAFKGFRIIFKNQKTGNRVDTVPEGVDTRVISLKAALYVLRNKQQAVLRLNGRGLLR